MNHTASTISHYAAAHNAANPAPVHVADLDVNLDHHKEDRSIPLRRGVVVALVVLAIVCAVVAVVAS